MITTQEQIEAVLTGGVYSLVRKESGKSTITPADESAIFTIDKSDILNWVIKHGFPESTYHSEEGLYDGIYLIQSERGFVLYEQERGCKFREQNYIRIEDAIEPLVDMIIYRHPSIFK
jgi:hypothetical protein